MNAELTAALVTLIIAIAGLIKSIASSKSVDDVVKDREHTKNKRDKDNGLINYRLDKIEEFQNKLEIKQEKINSELYCKLNEVNDNVIKILAIFDEREKK